MGNHIRKGLVAGAIFGVIIIFLALIGFIETAAQLIGSLLSRTSPAEAPTNLLIFFGLLGLWAGARAAKRTGEDDSWAAALVSGLAVGHRTNDGHFVHELGHLGEGLADPFASVRLDGLHLAPVFDGGEWLGIPRFLMRRAARQEDVNDALGFRFDEVVVLLLCARLLDLQQLS